MKELLNEEGSNKTRLIIAPKLIKKLKVVSKSEAPKPVADDIMFTMFEEPDED